MKPGKKYIFASNPRSDLSQMYREMKTNLYTLDGTGTPPKTILVTSARNGEGKTITAVNLAVSLALDNRRVLLIDMNCNQPQLHKVFSRMNTWGLANVLQGSKDLDEAILDTAYPNLKLLPSGPEPDYLPSLLSSNRLKQLFEEAGRQFDVVIADGIASEEFAEIRLAACYCEGFIFVVNPKLSNRERIAKQLKGFDHVKAHLFGVVLNQI